MCLWMCIKLESFLKLFLCINWEFIILFLFFVKSFTKEILNEKNAIDFRRPKFKLKKISLEKHKLRNNKNTQRISINETIMMKISVAKVFDFWILKCLTKLCLWYIIENGNERNELFIKTKVILWIRNWLKKFMQRCQDHGKFHLSWKNFVNKINDILNCECVLIFILHSHSTHEKYLMCPWLYVIFCLECFTSWKWW